MTGTFTLSASGELKLTLAKPCTLEYVNPGFASPIVVNCRRVELDQIPVIAHTPWNQDIRGIWNDASTIVFRPDWKVEGVDPTADEALAFGARPWVVSGTQWAPTPEDAKRMVQLIGDATGTETEVVRGGPPPGLEVTVDVEGDSLRAGGSTTLNVRIANRGPGTAYRVVATTRAGINALRGGRLAFGVIKPGKDKVRSLKVVVPESETERDTMLVLTVSEANSAAPSNVSRRIAIAPSTAAPELAVQCTVEGSKAARPDLDAGQRLMLHCAVDNKGTADARQVELEASVANGPPGRSPPQLLAKAGHMTFTVPIVVPRSLPIDAPVEVAIIARDRATSRSARTTIVGVVRKPKLCEPGRFTQAQYRAKLKELRAAVAAGDITQAQLDRYDAELVTCLQ